MRYPGFLGPSNPTQSPYADAERLVNWYPEPIQSQGAPTPGFFLPTPGFRVISPLSVPNTRALAQVGIDRCFGVFGNIFGEVPATGSIFGLWPLVEDKDPATISYNGPTGGQLFVTSGGNGYLYDLATQVFTNVLPGEATMGGMKDGRFFAFNKTNGHVRFSALNNGLVWDPQAYFSRSIAPDPWRAMVVGNPEIWMIGDQTSEAWYNANTFPQPYAPILSSFMQAGTNAPWSVTLNGPAPCFLNHNANGAATIVQIEGFTPKPISNFAVATALAAFDRAGTLPDCESFVYQQDGHTFVVFNFATAHRTWVYDATTSLWHERGEWVPDETDYDVWMPRVHCHAFGRHLVGGRTNNLVAEMNTAYATEATGTVIRRLRVPPPLWAPLDGRLAVDRLTLRLEAGLGLLSGQGSDPQVHLRVSQDGKTWSPPRQASAGRMGEYHTQVAWNRCGGSDTLWVPEITVSDPVPWRLAGCEIDGVGLQTRAA